MLLVLGEVITLDPRPIQERNSPRGWPYIRLYTWYIAFCHPLVRLIHLLHRFPLPNSPPEVCLHLMLDLWSLLGDINQCSHLDLDVCLCVYLYQYPYLCLHPYLYLSTNLCLHLGLYLYLPFQPHNLSPTQGAFQAGGVRSVCFCLNSLPGSPVLDFPEICSHDGPMQRRAETSPPSSREYLGVEVLPQ